MEEVKKIIEIEGLDKSYGSVHALRGLSFSVREGELFAFLGENGAGKSTAISIICGTLRKDSGKVVIDGVDIDQNPEAVRGELGVVFQASALDKQLTVYDNLAHRASLYGIYGEALKARLKELDELLELEPLFRRTLGKLSGGQRRRIDIARALLHKPKILILDEPTTGLDPQTRANIWQVVQKLRREMGVTVLLTTHYMEEAADADYVVIIGEGQILAKGTPLELKNTYTGDFITLYGATEEQISTLGVEAEKIAGAYRISVPDTAAATELIRRHPEVFTDYEVVKGRMDDVFLAVTGKSGGGNE